MKERKIVIAIIAIITIITAITINTSATYINANNVVNIKLRTKQTFEQENVQWYDWNYEIIDDNTIKTDSVAYTCNGQEIKLEFTQTAINSIDVEFKVYITAGAPLWQGNYPAWLQYNNGNSNAIMFYIYSPTQIDNQTYPRNQCYYEALGNNTFKIVIHYDYEEWKKYDSTLSQITTNNFSILTQFNLISSYIYIYNFDIKINNQTYKIANNISNSGEKISEKIEEIENIESELLPSSEEQSNINEELESIIDNISEEIEASEYPFEFKSLYNIPLIMIIMTVVCGFMFISLLVYGRH